ncbi:MAG: PIN domain protein [Candidatus Omnitrophica bacterium]|nr:PIN domain protein [Candidatus Omnitrophota bacterium]
MKKLRIYIDTSVVGGCFDDEFSEWSNLLVDNFRKGYLKPIVSDMLADEISRAPARVKDKYREILDYGAEEVATDATVLKLVQDYLHRKILDTKFKSDLTHIALATVHNADVLVSWNFKHIVQYAKISQFNAVNIEQGYKTIGIYSPREVVL